MYKSFFIGPNITYCFHLTKSSYTQSITEICFSTAGHSCYDKVLPFINPMAFRQLQDGSSIQLSCRIVYRFIDISRWIAESCKLQQTVEFFVISYLPFTHLSCFRNQTACEEPHCTCAACLYNCCRSALRVLHCEAHGQSVLTIDSPNTLAQRR